MRILFLSHYFPPEVNAPAVRTLEHCREWAAAGHDVHVVTCVPSHPAGRPFPGYRRGWYQYETREGVHVHRVWTWLAANRGTLRRTLNYLSFAPSAAYRAWRLGRFDVVVGTSPQFFCAVAAWAAARRRGTPWVFELRDLWPESIAAVGAMQRSAALRAIERLELYLYRDAAAIACVTRSFMENLEARGIDARKLHYLPNGIVPDVWTSADRTESRRALGVPDHVVLVSYVGTIGMAHGIGTVLDAAARLRDIAPHVRILIAGDGAQLEAMRGRAGARHLDNVRFTGLVPRDRVPSLLAASDVLLVPLRGAAVFRTVLPSKLFEAMAAARPVVLAVEGEARRVLDASGGGMAVPPDDAAALATAVATLAGDPALRASMGRSGHDYVQREFNRRAWAARYLRLLASLCPAASPALAATSHRTAVE